MTYRNFAISSLSRDIATIDAHGYVITIPQPHIFREDCARGCGIHTGVGFCVARSDRLGNAKASIRGTGNGYELPRLFCMCAKTRNNHIAFGEIGGCKRYGIKVSCD